MSTIIGFTGTQKGCTEQQIQWLESSLVHPSITGFHHGDCIGADADAHHIAYISGLPITIHPPINRSKRAYCARSEAKNVIILEPKEYITRNHDIVDACTCLFACPYEFYEQLRSGTWATIRYATRLGKRLWIIFPDGSVEKRNY